MVGEELGGLRQIPLMIYLFVRVELLDIGCALWIQIDRALWIQVDNGWVGDRDVGSHIPL